MHNFSWITSCYIIEYEISERERERERARERERERRERERKRERESLTLYLSTTLRVVFFFCPFYNSVLDVI